MAITAFPIQTQTLFDQDNTWTGKNTFGSGEGTYPESEVPILVNVAQGSASSPTTDTNPTAGIIRTETIGSDTSGGQNAALYVYSKGTGSNPASHENGQVNALTVKADQYGYGDVVGLYAVAGQHNPHSDDCSAYPLYAVPVVATAGMGAAALGTGILNFSGSDVPFVQVFPGIVAMDAVAQAGNLCTAAVQTRGAGGCQFDVVIGCFGGSIKTAIVKNYSNSVSVIVDLAAHTDGIDFSGATFSGNAFKSPGFAVDGSGNLSALSLNETGAWTTFTSTATPGAGAITTQASNSKYRKIGKTVLVSIDVTITNVGTASGGVVLSLPVAAGGTMALSGRENAVSGKAIHGVVGNGNTTLQLSNYDNSSVSLANNAEYILTGVYMSQ